MRIDEYLRNAELVLLVVTRKHAAGPKQHMIYYHGAFGATRRALLATAASAAGAFGEVVLPAGLAALVLRALS